MEYFVSIDSSGDKPQLKVEDQRFPLTIFGCREAGQYLRKQGADSWMCSSSIDFPEEFGFDQDIRELLQEGWSSPSQEQIVRYLNGLQSGERVVETTPRTMTTGQLGTVYIGKQGEACVRWDGPEKMGTSASYGTRRIEEKTREISLASQIADQLLWISGINKPGTSIAPAIGEQQAGSYNRRELIDEIQLVLNQNGIDR